MADHLEDDEQVEALKRWWDENGKGDGCGSSGGGGHGWLAAVPGLERAQAELASEAWSAIEAELQRGEERSRGYRTPHKP